MYFLSPISILFFKIRNTIFPISYFNGAHPGAFLPFFCSHVGCVCKDGWEGDYCEYKEGEAPYKEVESPSKPGNTNAIIPLAIGCSILAVGGIFLISKKLMNRREQDIAAPNSPVGYHGDEQII